MKHNIITVLASFTTRYMCNKYVSTLYFGWFCEITTLSNKSLNSIKPKINIPAWGYLWIQFSVLSIQSPNRILVSVELLVRKLFALKYILRKTSLKFRLYCIISVRRFVIRNKCNQLNISKGMKNSCAKKE